MNEIEDILAKAIADATRCGVNDYPAPYDSPGIPASDLAPDVLANIEAAGYVIVPRDPTEAMLAAAGPSMKRVNDLLALAAVHHATLTWDDDKPPLWHAWKAMIAEAQK